MWWWFANLFKGFISKVEICFSLDLFRRNFFNSSYNDPLEASLFNSSNSLGLVITLPLGIGGSGDGDTFDFVVLELSFSISENFRFISLAWGTIIFSSPPIIFLPLYSSLASNCWTRVCCCSCLSRSICTCFFCNISSSLWRYDNEGPKIVEVVVTAAAAVLAAAATLTRLASIRSFSCWLVF